ncbi:hypothetical protein KFL_003150120 [Klebsormidium nitens]|uniref:Peptidase A1 domain-containing protein n=1 Tax=Klebsormidium nitens TaxID=105231 RepID=A0A1Y1IDP5_KLENI|nr:hypothetical protein KFL_003150120 [Klebsormidium nitens]|eukprot:GAQ86847.1 hypothetical protein KFL_003150120 [Klebsormidium nitens]
MSPKIHIWNTGPGGGDASADLTPLRNILSSLPPMLDAVEGQTDFRAPEWLAGVRPGSPKTAATDMDGPSRDLHHFSTAVIARAIPSAAGGNLDPPQAHQLGKRALLASGLPEAVSSLSLTKIERGPDPSISVSARSFNPESSAGGENIAVLVASPVSTATSSVPPVTGGYQCGLALFTASIGVGTPPQAQTVIIDSGR